MPPRDDDELPGRPKRYDDDIAYRDDDLIRDEDGEARRRVRSAGMWFFVAAGVTLLLSAADIVKSVTIGEFADLPLAGPERSIALVFLTVFIAGCGAVLIALNVLIMVAGRKLQSFGAKGWVITGIVLVFVQVFLFAGSALIEAITVFVNPDEAMAKWVPLSIVFDCISGALNALAGIRGIIVLNDPGVRDEFERHRRLRLHGPRDNSGY